MKQLLDARAPANASDEHGLTPLHKAAVGGRTEAAELLLNAGASYNARVKVGVSLHPVTTKCKASLLFCSNVHHPCVTRLLKVGG